MSWSSDFQRQPGFQLNQLVAVRISPESFFDGNQPLPAFRVKGAGVVLKEKVVLDNARFHS